MPAQETPLQGLQRTWHALVSLLATAAWRLLDKMVWKLDQWLNPQKPEAKLPEPVLPIAPSPEPALANVSPMQPAQPRIPKRPTVPEPMRPGTLAKQRLRAITASMAAIPKRKPAEAKDMSFLLDQPAKTA